MHKRGIGLIALAILLFGSSAQAQQFNAGVWGGSLIKGVPVQIEIAAGGTSISGVWKSVTDINSTNVIATQFQNVALGGQFKTSFGNMVSNIRPCGNNVCARFTWMNASAYGGMHVDLTLTSVTPAQAQAFPPR